MLLRHRIEVRLAGSYGPLCKNRSSTTCTEVGISVRAKGPLTGCSHSCMLHINFAPVQIFGHCVIGCYFRRTSALRSWARTKIELAALASGLLPSITASDATLHFTNLVSHVFSLTGVRVKKAFCSFHFCPHAGTLSLCLAYNF
jgi:hypothetical protein